MALTTVTTYVEPGDRVRVELPYSEVCMHMRLAGEVREIVVLENMAQILDTEGRNYSFPVTYGEAGIYSDRFGHYVHEVSSD